MRLRKPYPRDYTNTYLRSDGITHLFIYTYYAVAAGTILCRARVSLCSFSVVSPAVSFRRRAQGGWDARATIIQYRYKDAETALCFIKSSLRGSGVV